MRVRAADLLKGWRSRRLRMMAGLGALAGVATAAAVSHGQTSVGVLKVRLGGDAHQTRLVVELDRPTRGQLLTDGDAASQGAHGVAEPRVRLMLANVDVPGDMQGQGEGLVKSWQVDEAAGAAQIRLVLTHPAQVRRRFLLPPGDGLNVYRYVVDLSDDLSAQPSAPAAPQHPAPGSSTAKTARTAGQRPAVRPVVFSAPLTPAVSAKKVIVIDPGHGGGDPGAGGRDVHEKLVTLAAAQQLRARLEQTGRYKVVMTRDTDTYIPLETRVKIARRANADLFISLHADSGSSDSIRGATVYTLSEQGADRADRQVFERANWINVELPGSDESVNRILLDLTQRQTRNRSSTFAELLLDNIGDRTHLLQRSHRDAGFMVLLAPDVPAVLLEMGFLTNLQDEHELLDPAYRRRLMDGVTQAIDDYFTEDAKIASR